VQRALIGCLAVFAVLLLPGLASAQSGSGIAGVVKDASGAVLPGVTVEASSPALIEKVRTAVTDGEGQYKIVDLRPGTYSVTFALAGFNTEKQEGIELTASFTATVNGQLRVGALEETITVSAQTPTVDVQNVAQEKVMTRDVINAVPAGTKSVVTLGVLIPGMNTNNQDVGGAAFSSSQIAIHGGKQGEQQLLYDGMYYNNGQGRGGQYTAIATNDATVQEVSLETGGLSAESELGGVRTNIVPKDGGNTFKGYFFGAFTNSTLQSNNLTPALQAQGLTSVNHVNQIYDVDPAFGGPIEKDRLWFYGSVRKWASEQYVAGIFYNESPVPYAYTPNQSAPAQNNEINGNESLRLTWQASPRDKITAQFQEAQQNRPFYGYSLGQTLSTPDAVYASKSIPDYFGQVGWSSPVTSRLLLEAGYAYANKDFATFLQPGVSASTPAYKDLSTGITWGNYPSTYGANASHQQNGKLTASYVTGSHAAKFGFTFMHMWSLTSQNVADNGAPLLTLNKGVPTQVTEYATPLTVTETMGADVGLFGQDQWTIKRLTLNMGVRFDYLNAYIPAQTLGPGPAVPTRNSSYPELDNVPDWKNVSPRLGAAYDLLGTGKTALKVNVGRYLEGPNLNVFTQLANPAAAISTSASRTWNDTNGNFIADCNFSNPAANGECGAVSNKSFGLPVITTQYAPGALTTRGYNWEAQGGVQQELLRNVSVAATYTRRWYGNIRATQNTDVSSANYSPFCITTPVNAGLPGGGGNQACGFYDINPAQSGLVNNVVSVAPQLQDVYDGVDLTGNVRLPKGVQLAGGVSIGRERTNDCYMLGDLSLAFLGSNGTTSVQSPRTSAFCNITPPFQPNVKLMAVYPLPWWGIQTSAAFQSLPGPQITATYAATNAQIAPSLGRNLSPADAGVITVDLIAPGTLYAERLNQLDFRLAKTIVFGGRRLQGMVDLYNLSNANAPLTLNNTYGPAWQRPTQIEQGRLLKFGVQIDF
jgi:hypothetical protein